jgi:hypothetical protein
VSFFKFTSHAPSSNNFASRTPVNRNSYICVCIYIYICTEIYVYRHNCTYVNTDAHVALFIIKIETTSPLSVSISK